MGPGGNFWFYSISPLTLTNHTLPLPPSHTHTHPSLKHRASVSVTSVSQSQLPRHFPAVRSEILPPSPSTALCGPSTSSASCLESRMPTMTSLQRQRRVRSRKEEAMEREKEWKVRLVLSPQAVCPKNWHLFAYKLGDVSLGVSVYIHVGLLCKRPCTLFCYQMRDNNGIHENKNDRAMAVS